MINRGGRINGMASIRSCVCDELAGVNKVEGKGETYREDLAAPTKRIPCAPYVLPALLVKHLCSSTFSANGAREFPSRGGYLRVRGGGEDAFQVEQEGARCFLRVGKGVEDACDGDVKGCEVCSGSKRTVDEREDFGRDQPIWFVDS
jgi:hypothetical protein